VTRAETDAEKQVEDALVRARKFRKATTRNASRRCKAALPLGVR
jgi:hypothetical protein